MEILLCRDDGRSLGGSYGDHDMNAAYEKA